MSTDAIANLLQLIFTASPTAAVLVFMWLNRNPTAKEKAADPTAALAAKLTEIATVAESTDETVRATEDRIIAMQSDINILKDRKAR